jgi:hypothetical protein
MRFVKSVSDTSVRAAATTNTEHPAHDGWWQAWHQVKQSQALLRADGKQSLQAFIDECGDRIGVALK